MKALAKNSDPDLFDGEKKREKEALSEEEGDSELNRTEQFRTSVGVVVAVSVKLLLSFAVSFRNW